MEAELNDDDDENDVKAEYQLGDDEDVFSAESLAVNGKHLLLFILYGLYFRSNFFNYNFHFQSAQM